MVPAVVLTLTACGGNQQEASEEQTTAEPTTEQKADVRNRTQRENESDRGRSREVTLEIGGDPGIEFSGTCTVGDEEYPLSGQTPESFGYDPNGRELGCEIRKRDEGTGGNLQVTLTANGTHSVQQINTGTLKLTYANGSVSSSTSSSGSSSQTSSSSVVNSGSSMSSSSSVSSSSSTSSR